MINMIRPVLDDDENAALEDCTEEEAEDYVIVDDVDHHENDEVADLVDEECYPPRLIVESVPVVTLPKARAMSDSEQHQFIS